MAGSMCAKSRGPPQGADMYRAHAKRRWSPNRELLHIRMYYSMERERERERERLRERLRETERGRDIVAKPQWGAPFRNGLACFTLVSSGDRNGRHGFV